MQNNGLPDTALLTPYEHGQIAARANAAAPPFPTPDTSWADRLYARGWADEMERINAR